MEGALEQILQQQQIWTQQILAQQQEFFAGILNQRNLSPVSSIMPINIAVPKFHHFDDESNDFDTYKRQLEEHFKAYTVEDDDRKRSFLLSWIGDKTFRVLNKLVGKTNLQLLSYSELVASLDAHYKSKTHVIKSRYEFYKRMKGEGENYNQWVAELRGMARECNFICKNGTCGSDFADELIRDILILYTPDEPVRTAALHKDEPTLKEVLQIAETFEATQRTISSIKTNQVSDNEVFVVKQDSRTASQQKSRQQWPACSGCFKKHDKDKCKYLKAQCFICKKIGHIASVCKSKSNSNSYVRTVEDDTTIMSCDVRDNAISRSGHRMIINVKINGQDMKFQFDTGAMRSVIGVECYKSLGSPVLEPTSVRLFGYGNAQIPVLGSMVVDVQIQDEHKRLDLIVADSTECSSIFGLNWYDEFKVVQIFNVKENLVLKSICNEFKELFSEELGLCKTAKAHIYMKPDARPKFFKPRPIPYTLNDSFKKEAHRLTELGIWKPIKYSQWAAPLVIVPKQNNKIRVCADFKVTINPHMDIEQYPIPRIRDLFHKLRNGEHFSKIDLSDAYLQIEMDEESKPLLVVNTPLGLFQYERLPFGVSSAPAIFQRLIEQTISDIPGCVNYLDDIIVTGRTEKEHLNNLRQVFKKLSDSGFRCNLSKCSFLEPKVEYLGHVISGSGIYPSESRTDAIRNLPRPKDISELQSFMGKVNYYCSFIKNYSTVCGPLNLLRKKTQSFKWGAEQERAFQELKTQLVELAELAHFDENLPIVLATDASSYGIGAVISHKYPDGSERPIAYASKTLSDNQRNYSQIEKEGLSIIFGVRKFHDYLYGRKFTLVTDHKPLVSIFNPSKRLNSTTAHRLQRWALILSEYNYDIHFRSTKNHGNADALSRLPVRGDLDFDESIEVNEIRIDDCLENFPLNAEQVADYTKKDVLMSKVLDYVMDGWPEKVTDRDMIPYFRQRFNLTHCKGVLIMQTDYSRIVIPKELRSRVLNLIHQGHWGIVRMKQISRRYCWWPNIDDDIGNLVSSCRACNVCSSDPPRQFSSWPTPTAPWQRIHLDYAGPFNDSMWLIVVDSYSQYPFVAKIKNATSLATIKALQSIFSIEGLPETVITDNGTQFTSNEFKQFCEFNGIHHLTSAPFHPASNGQAERFVRTFKTSLKKQLTAGSNLETSLLAYLTTYRSTPNKDGKSPAELIHGRQPRTLLSLLKPSIPPSCNGPNSMATAKYFDVNDNVLCKNFSRGEKWLHGIIVQRLGNVMYLVDIGNRIIKRHKNQIRSTKSKPDYVDVHQSARLLMDSCSSPHPEFSNVETALQTIPTSYSSVRDPFEESNSTSHYVFGQSLQSEDSPPNQEPATPQISRKSNRLKRKPDRYSPTITKKLARRK